MSAPGFAVMALFMMGCRRDAHDEVVIIAMVRLTDHGSHADGEALIVLAVERVCSDVYRGNGPCVSELMVATVQDHFA